MTQCLRVRSGLFGLAVLLAVALWSAGAHAQSGQTRVALPAKPIHYAVKARSVTETARDLEMLLNVSVRLRLTRETISGNWGGRNAAQFLTAFAESLEADWYFDGTHVHLVPQSERETLRLRFVNEFQAQSFLRLLRDNAWPGSGLEAEVVRAQRTEVAGPHWWLERARALHRMFDTQHTRIVSVDPESREGVMIFGLRHAWADDKELKFGDKLIKVPGVAQLLRSVVNDRVAPAVPQPSGTAAPAARPATAAGFVEITADVRLNAVLIRDAISNFYYYHSIIGGLDTPAKMVMLDAYIIDVSKSRLKDFGIDWQVAEGDYTGGFGVPGAPREQTLNFNFGTGAALSSVLTDSGVLARARFLQTDGDSTIVSVPSVLTLDNQEAIFSTTETFYARVTGERVAELIPVRAETELRVTPHILTAGDGTPAVQLLVSIKDGSIDSSEQAMVDALPRVTTHYLTTQAIVRKGQSLVVGGQVVSRNVESLVRVPVLSWLPIVGLLFQQRRDEVREYVRIFIIQPRFAPNL